MSCEWSFIIEFFSSFFILPIFVIRLGLDHQNLYLNCIPLFPVLNPRYDKQSHGSISSRLTYSTVSTINLQIHHHLTLTIELYFK